MCQRPTLQVNEQPFWDCMDQKRDQVFSSVEFVTLEHIGGDIILRKKKQEQLQEQSYSLDSLFCKLVWMGTLFFLLFGPLIWE